MESKSFVTDYQKVVKVLDSCITDEQIKVAENFFKLFLTKWNDKMSHQNYLMMVYHYGKLRNDKMMNLYKKV